MRKKNWGYDIIENSYKEGDIEIIVCSYLYGEERNNKLRRAKLEIDGEKLLKEIHKKIFYPLNYKDDKKKVNTINRN